MCIIQNIFIQIFQHCLPQHNYIEKTLVISMGLSWLKCFSNEPTEGHYSEIVLNREQMSPWTAAVSPEVFQQSLYNKKKKLKKVKAIDRLSSEGDTLYSEAYHMKM